MTYDDAVRFVYYNISKLDKKESSFLYVDNRELDEEEEKEFEKYHMIFITNIMGSSPTFIEFSKAIINLKNIIKDKYHDTFAYRIENYGKGFGGYIGINKNK